MSLLTHSLDLGASRRRSPVDYLISFLKRSWTLYTNRRAVTRLCELDDHILEDMGISRSEVHGALSSPIWADPSSELRLAQLTRDRQEVRR